MEKGALSTDNFAKYIDDTGLNGFYYLLVIFKKNIDLFLFWNVI